MVIQNLLLADESYTHKNWAYKDVLVGYSRIYYILGGEAYYEEEGQRIRLKPHHLYITPVKHCFSLSENPQDKLYHTYAHITTYPSVDCFTEIEVKDGTLLADAVALWRKYTPIGDEELIRHVLEFLLSCIERTGADTASTVAKRAKEYIDRMEDSSLTMESMSRALGYSREYLTRSFLAAYHTTPKQYFQKKRMSTALRHLMAGERVRAVADAMGYASAYAFSKAFKKHFGLSPQYYRSTVV